MMVVSMRELKLLGVVWTYVGIFDTDQPILHPIISLDISTLSLYTRVNTTHLESINSSAISSRPPSPVAWTLRSFEFLS